MFRKPLFESESLTTRKNVDTGGRTLNQNRKNHPFLRRALTAVLTLLMLVNVCFPAMQAHATEETLENYLQFDMAITNAKAAANALDPQSETFQQDARQYRRP